MEPDAIAMGAAEVASALPDWGKVGGVGGVLILCFFYFTKLIMRKVVEETAASARGAAEISIIDSLRDEIVRLGAQNVALMDQVAMLSEKVSALQTENIRLRSEVQAMSVRLVNMNDK